ncbi:MAG: hypothetical protein KC496_16035 [Anaerolineae bacterium]|nr:hypothetical protein [Anaerolineae bacterium]
MLDLWEQLQGIFLGNPEDTPEIIITNLTDEQTAECIRVLITRARECSTQFFLGGTQYSVIVASLEVALELLQLRKISAAFWLSLPILPQLGVFVERPGTIVLSYERDKWTAMSLIALFDLLDALIAVAPNAKLRLDDIYYSADERTLFARVWQAYQNVAS